MIIVGPWSVSTADDGDDRPRSLPIREAPAPPASTSLLPNRGRRTARELALATVPARATWVVAGMAVCLAIGLNAINWLIPSPRLTTYAHMFEVLPIWLLIGGSLHQVGARIVQAWDDFGRHWRNE